MAFDVLAGSNVCCHAQRPEQAILKDFCQRRAFELFGDEAEQGIVGVAIFVFRAGSEVAADA